MPFQISMTYGDFTISHDDSQDTMEAMQSGVYASAMHFVAAKMVQVMESNLLSEDPDYDREATALLSQNGSNSEATVEAAPEEEGPARGNGDLGSS